MSQNPLLHLVFSFPLLTLLYPQHFPWGTNAEQPGRVDPKANADKMRLQGLSVAVALYSQFTISDKLLEGEKN